MDETLNEINETTEIPADDQQETTNPSVEEIPERKRLSFRRTGANGMNTNLLKVKSSQTNTRRRRQSGAMKAERTTWKKSSLMRTA